jgi:hypothetical protein
MLFKKSLLAKMFCCSFSKLRIVLEIKWRARLFKNCRASAKTQIKLNRLPQNKSQMELVRASSLPFKRKTNSISA